MTERKNEQTDTELAAELIDHLARPENHKAARLLRDIPDEAHAILARFYKSVRDQRGELK